MNNGNNEVHALLSPSSAKKVLGCAAALLCESDIPNESGERAVFGTCVHTLSEFSLNKYKKGDPVKLTAYAAYYLDKDGHGPMHTTGFHEPETKITREMVEFAEKYCDYAKAIIDSAEYSAVEMRVDLTKLLHPGYKLLVDAREVIGEEDVVLVEDYEEVKTFGTADLVAVIPRTDGSYTLFIGDLKTGRHKVDAKENWQLMLYAIGVMRKLARRYNITLIRLAIFQPLAGGASEYDMTPEALELFRKHASRRAVTALDVYAAGKKALKPKDFTPSDSACQWCRFAEKCNAKAKAAKVAVVSGAVSDDDLADEPTTIERTFEQLEADYEALDSLRQHIAATEKAYYKALMSGQKSTKYKLVEGKPGNRAWSDAGLVEAEFIRRDLKHDVFYKESFISPTDAQKILSPEDYAAIEQFITRKPGQPSIAAADDKRPEYMAVNDADLA